MDKFDRLNFFFCNQGMLMPPKVFEDQTLEDFYLVMENNCKSVFLALVNPINLFKKQDSGSILVTAS